MKTTILNQIKFIVVLLLMFSCAEDSLLDNPPRSGITVDNFFQNDAQVLSVGASLYSTPWFYYNYRLHHTMGAYAGNVRVESGDYAGFKEMNVNSLNGILYEGYFSLWWVVANTNSLLDNLENRTGPGVTQAGMDRARGEALVTRAIAYFQIVRTWGAVPILEDIKLYETNELVPKNPVEDVYKFIIRDLEEAATLLPETRQSDGRASRQVANAYLSKVHLTLQNYDEALAKSEEVIQSGQFGLLPNYQDLYKEAFDNSEESIYALQWLACQGWGQGNSTQAWTAPFGAGITKVNDGWGAYKVPQDLIDAYEDGDERRYHTVMEENNFYPELKTTEGGYLHAINDPHFRKYIVGSPDETNVCRMETGNNTYMMRYAEVLLIHAEAILGNNVITSDGDALNSINMVRARAGLEPLTVITLDDILHERRIELVFEGVYWYDLARIDRQKAVQMLMGRNRGTIEIPFSLASVEDNDFLLPIPQVDVDKNPNLAPDVEPVPYDFNK